MIKTLVLSTAFCFALAAGAQAGCLTGAAVGGAVGHVAGHHGVIGAAVGCAVGHHRAAKERQANTPSPSNQDNNNANH